MICAWIETSRAVVGSSAMISLGSAQSAKRDHHPLAHAARELVRIGAEALLRTRDADLAQELDRPFAGLRSSRSRWVWMVSISCWPR
jgi:hypothetical protein